MLYRAPIAILLVSLAFIAWGLVGYFAWTISVDESNRVADAREAQMVAVSNAHAVRTRALALDTVDEGARLKALLDVDVVSAAYMIEEVGKIAGVTVKLSDAQPEGSPAPDGSAVKVVGFVVTADGTFPALMRAARLFETLPIPSSVTRLDIEHAPKAAGTPSSLWHMSVYIRVLTTSDISS